MSLLKNTGDIWLPPPDLTISQWADEYRRIPPEASAEPGMWHTDRAPYQREMMDASGRSRRVIMMTAAQVGKTEILLNTIGYYIDKEPSPVLLIQPTLEMGESFSKDRLAPMIRDTPCLLAKIGDVKSRSAGNTLLHKKFDGGHITIAGANSPASLASRPVRVLLCDEVDRYPASAGTEGDPLGLAEKRTANFWNSLMIWVSTPTAAGFSRIEKAFALSTREEWHVPCPGCGGFVPFQWESIYYRDVSEPLMECPLCRRRFTEREWKRGSFAGKWIAAGPENGGIQADGLKQEPPRGFHLNAFASPWVTWEELCMKYEEALRDGEESLRVWHNTVLGLPYDAGAGASADAGAVSGRREDYGAELPDGVLALTCGVDVQDDRLELEVVGWGLYKESWGIEYKIMHGEPGTSALWEQLDAYLQKSFYFADGTGLGISCACIDSGGHFTDQVYKFVKGKAHRKVYAVVGRGTFGKACVSKPSRNNRARIPLFTLGVSTIKSLVYARLKASEGEGGCCHFPADDSKGYTERYFRGLASERMVLKRRGGIDTAVWIPKGRHVRNEPLDCRVYATGALEILNPDFRRRLELRGKKPEPSAKPSARASRPRMIVRRGLKF